MVFGDEGVSTMTTETAQADVSADVAAQEDTQMADTNATVEPAAEAQEPTETQAN